MQCRIWADGTEAACAYCRCKSVSGCNAKRSDAVEEEEEEEEEETTGAGATSEEELTLARVAQVAGLACEELRDALERNHQHHEEEMRRAHKRIDLHAVNFARGVHADRERIKALELRNETLEREVAELKGKLLFPNFRQY